MENNSGTVQQKPFVFRYLRCAENAKACIKRIKRWPEPGASPRVIPGAVHIVPSGMPSGVFCRDDGNAFIGRHLFFGKGTCDQQPPSGSRGTPDHVSFIPGLDFGSEVFSGDTENEYDRPDCNRDYFFCHTSIPSAYLTILKILSVKSTT